MNNSLHVLSKDYPDPMIILSKLKEIDGVKIMTSEPLQDVTDEALRAVASYLLAKAKEVGQDWYGLIYGLRDGHELQLQVHIKEAEE